MKKFILAVVALSISVLCSAQWKTQFGGNEVSVNAGTSLALPGSYSDFIMEFEYQTDGSGAAVRFLSNSANGTGYLFVIDESAERSWNGGVYDAVNLDWSYPLTYNDEARSASKKGQWNKGRIEVSDGLVRTFVNGVECANLLVSPDAAGSISLQANPNATAPAKWRNVRIAKASAGLTAANPAVFQVNGVANTLTAKQAADGWKLLFDGKTSEGWCSAKGTDVAFPTVGWKVGDGIMMVTESEGPRSPRGGDVMTKDEFENFWLSVDFKLTPGANGGIKYSNMPNSASLGCEFQILDDELHPDAKAGIDGNRTVGSLYDLIRSDKSKLFFDKSEWHTAWIKVEGDHVEHWLDGTKVVEYDRNNQEFNALIATSKYKDYPNFGNYTKSHILLQDHFNQVSYRNIMIKELPAAAAKAPAKSLAERFDMNSGWKVLWDGPDCAGNWETIRGGQDFPQRGWGIEDNMIVANPDPESRGGSDIMTKETFKDFILTFEFHLTEGANGGIKYFVNPGTYRDPSIGCEFQVLDDYKHPDAKLGTAGNRTCGSLYDLIRAEKDGANYQVDAWNTGTILVQGNHVEHWLNGVKVVEYERNTQEFNALVGTSKFRSNKGFGNFESGHIQIQNHMDNVFYRNIKIKEL